MDDDVFYYHFHEYVNIVGLVLETYFYTLPNGSPANDDEWEMMPIKNDYDIVAYCDWTRWNSFYDLPMMDRWRYKI